MIAKPIIMSTPMVQAILREVEKPGAGKTMTRRLTGKNGKASSWLTLHDLVEGGEKAALWVKETYRLRADQDHKKPSEDWWKSGAWYYADDPELEPSGCGGGAGKLRPSIHMPKWASRLTLEVTGTKVERLQEISKEDAIAEGVERAESAFMHAGWLDYESELCDDGKPGWLFTDPIKSFASLWRNLHGAGAWDANHEIVAISFKPHLKNIGKWSAA